jgi:hypothetical protein
MPIFRVEAEIEVMVFAKDEDEAERLAADAVRAELRYGEPTLWPPTRVEDVPSLMGWQDCSPYNRKDSMTCRAVMEAEAAAEAARPPTLEEIEAAGQQRLIA